MIVAMKLVYVIEHLQITGTILQLLMYFFKYLACLPLKQPITALATAASKQSISPLPSGVAWLCLASAACEIPAHFHPELTVT